jgi:DNA-binding response OmpR family regulator
MDERKQILIVDDDPILGPVIAETLEMLGFQPTLVSSVKAANDCLVAVHRFAAVLLDLDLGKFRGEVMIEELRGERSPRPAIVIFSARPTEELLRASDRVKAKSILRKPASLKELRQAIEAAIT